MTSATLLTLAARSGSITAADALTLLAGNGIMIQDSLTGGGTSGTASVVINSDSDSNAADPRSGVLTLQTGKTLTATNNAVAITAYDIDLDGSVAAGAVVVHMSKESASIGLGANTSTDMDISDAELGRITTSVNLEIGSSASGDMIVGGITDGNSDSIGTPLRLIATQRTPAPSKTITFAAYPSVFNKGLQLEAAGGVAINTDLTTKMASTIDTGAGMTFTLAYSTTLSTSGTALTILTDDMNLAGISLNTGAAVLAVDCKTSTVVTLRVSIAEFLALIPLNACHVSLVAFLIFIVFAILDILDTSFVLHVLEQLHCFVVITQQCLMLLTSVHSSCR